MPDFDAIGVALAARYAPAQVTAPAGGYQNIRVSTNYWAAAALPLPFVYVVPSDGAFVTGNGSRQGAHNFLVRFYFAESGTPEKDSKALGKWMTVLVDQLKLATQFAGIVSVARVMDWRLGILPFGGKEYSGIELTVHVVTDESWAAVS